MFTLNTNEQNEYRQLIKNIPNLRPGKYYASDLYQTSLPGAPTNPRVMRYFYENVKAGSIAGVSLTGQKRSRDGYLIQ